MLAARWTRIHQPVLPPLDWDAPRRSRPSDRQAWDLVEEAAEQGDTVAMETLSEVDIYIGDRPAAGAATGRPLPSALREPDRACAGRRAAHRPGAGRRGPERPLPPDPRRRPGHPVALKTAVQAAGYIQKASDIYSYLLPLFSPVTGLVRLGTQQWMVKPAWRNMQQNLLRWFFRAYINRLGTHLIELYSGRLVIGADQYRRLTRRAVRAAHPFEEEMGPLTIAVAGAAIRASRA